jgi:hypothetical protein
MSSSSALLQNFEPDYSADTEVSGRGEKHSVVDITIDSSACLLRSAAATEAAAKHVGYHHGGNEDR